jgi:hypothetical protein
VCQDMLPLELSGDIAAPIGVLRDWTEGASSGSTYPDPGSGLNRAARCVGKLSGNMS